jgi:hypothetical protein
MSYFHVILLAVIAVLFLLLADAEHRAKSAPFSGVRHICIEQTICD